MDGLEDFNYNDEVLKYWLIKEAAYKWQINKKSSDFFQWQWKKDLRIAINKNNNLEVTTFLGSFENYYLAIAYN